MTEHSRFRSLWNLRYTDYFRLYSVGSDYWTIEWVEHIGVQGVGDILRTGHPDYHWRRIRCYYLQNQTAQEKSSAWTQWSWNEDSTIFWNVGHNSPNDNSVTSQNRVAVRQTSLSRKIWCRHDMKSLQRHWKFSTLQFRGTSPNSKPCSCIIQASPSSATARQTSYAVS